MRGDAEIAVMLTTFPPKNMMNGNSMVLGRNVRYRHPKGTDEAFDTSLKMRMMKIRIKLSQSYSKGTYAYHFSAEFASNANLVVFEVACKYTPSNRALSWKSFFRLRRSIQTGDLWLIRRWLGAKKCMKWLMADTKNSNETCQRHLKKLNEKLETLWLLRLELRYC